MTRQCYGNVTLHEFGRTLAFFLNVFSEFAEFSDKIFYYSKRARNPCQSATSCVRDQHATTAPTWHMWKTGTLSWAQFMLQWFIQFPEFAELQWKFCSFRKNSINAKHWEWKITLLLGCYLYSALSTFDVSASYRRFIVKLWFIWSRVLILEWRITELEKTKQLGSRLP